MERLKEGGVQLTENDVPGAKLIYSDVSLHTVVQLKRCVTITFCLATLYSTYIIVKSSTPMVTNYRL